MNMHYAAKCVFTKPEQFLQPQLLLYMIIEIVCMHITSFLTEHARVVSDAFMIVMSSLTYLCFPTS